MIDISQWGWNILPWLPLQMKYKSMGSIINHYIIQMLKFAVVFTQRHELLIICVFPDVTNTKTETWKLLISKHCFIDTYVIWNILTTLLHFIAISTRSSVYQYRIGPMWCLQRESWTLSLFWKEKTPRLHFLPFGDRDQIHWMNSLASILLSPK